MPFILEDDQPSPGGKWVLEDEPPPKGKVVPYSGAKADFVSGVGMGLMDPIHAGAQMLTKALPDGVVNAGNRINNALADVGVPLARIPEGGVDQMVREREAQYQAARAAAGQSGLDGGRLVGNAAAMLPATIGAPGVLGSAAIGAGMGAMQPVTEGDFATEKAKQAGLGALAGGAGGAISKGLAGLISPKINPAAKALMDEGVELTPGQIAGGLARRTEDMAQSVPIMGGKIASARQAGVESFNRAAMNRALKEIGEELPKGMVGREAIEHMGNQIGAAYDKLVPQLRVQVDQPFVAQTTHLAQKAAAELEPGRAQQFATILEQKLGRMIGPQGQMTGEAFKQADSELGRLARQFSASPDADQRMLGWSLQDAQQMLRGLVTRGNPELAPELRKIDKAFATALRVERAAGAVGATDGVFTPAQLQNAVKAMDSSARKKQFSRGDALLQDLADAGKAVMPSTVGDSGTAGRAAQMAMAASIGMGNPLPIAASVAGAGLYSRPGQATLRALMTSRPAGAGTIAELIERGMPIPLTAGGYQLLNQ